MPQVINPIMPMIDAGRAAGSTCEGLPDEELARRAREGSLSAFGALMDRHGGRLRSYLLKRVRNGADAEELTQETFCRAWEKRASYRPGMRYSTWIFTIATRLATDRSRRRASEARWRTLQGAPGEPAGEEASPAASSGVWGVAERVLDGESASILWLRYGLDLELEEIARMTRRTGVGVRVLLFRARQRLKKELEQQGIGPAASGVESAHEDHAP